MPYEVFTLKHNPEKLDPEYYKKMLDYFDLKLEEVVYFEHKLEAVKSTQLVGIKTIYYENLEKLKEFLNKELIN